VVSVSSRALVLLLCLVCNRGLCRSKTRAARKDYMLSIAYETSEYKCCAADSGTLPEHFICLFLLICMRLMPLRMTRAQQPCPAWL